MGLRLQEGFAHAGMFPFPAERNRRETERNVVVERASSGDIRIYEYIYDIVNIGVVFDCYRDVLRFCRIFFIADKKRSHGSRRDIFSLRVDHASR